MSRIGKLPIEIPAGVNITVNNNVVTVKGPKGELSQVVDPLISIEMDGGVCHVTRPNDAKESRAKHGLYRALIHNMVKGVSEGYTKVLELVGVGLLAAGSAQPEQRDHQDGQDHGCNEVALRVGDLRAVGVHGVGEVEDHGHRNEGEDDADDLGAEAAGGGEVHADAGVNGNDVLQRLIGDGAGRVGHAGAYIGDESQDNLQQPGHREHGEGQDVEDGEDGSAEDHVGTETTPAGLGVVSDVAHHRVVDGVPDTGDQHDHGDRTGGERNDVGVERHQVGVDHVPTHLARDLT